MTPRKIKQSMYNKLESLNKHTHPNKLLSDLKKVITKVGAKEFLKKAGLNKERELFIGCMFAYAVRMITHNETYIQEVKNDPPDFRILTLTKRVTKDKPFDIANIEMVEIPQIIDKITSSEERRRYAVNLINKSKLDKYSPEKGTILLIFINSQYGHEINTILQQWHSSNKILFSNYGEIFTLYLLSSTNQEINYIVKSITKKTTYELNFKNEFNKKQIPHELIDKYGVEVVE